MKYIIITKRQLTIFCSIVVAGIFAIICSVGVFANTNRKLPIYCVETEEKKVAISFDAAWGNTKKVQNSANPVIIWVCA